MMARLLEFYKRWISPPLHTISGMGGACRFQPTCSEYAAAAFAQHGMWRASALVVWRLLRCNPFCRGGFDPVPAGPRAFPFLRGTDERRHLP
jgi:uncharacterized protein